MVTGQRPLQRVQHLRAVRGVGHVDEIDDDDAAEVAQTQLPGDGHGRLQVGSENRVFQVPVPDESAGMYVDSAHRLGLVDHQMPARLEVDVAIEGLADLVLDTVQVEDRSLAGVQLYAGVAAGHEALREFEHARVRSDVVDQHAV